MSAVTTVATTTPATTSKEPSEGTMSQSTPWTSLDTTCIILCISVIIIHTYGIYLFFKTTRRNQNFDARNNNFEIISLSFSTIVMAVAYINHVIIASLKPALLVYSVIPIYMMSLPFYGSLIMLTLQRFFAIYFHLRYQSTFVYHKRKHMVIAFYACAGGFGIIDVGLYIAGEGKGVAIYLEKTVVMAALFATNVIFIVVYIYIFIKYKRASRHEQTSFYKPERSTFFTPIIIYVSLLIFGTIPYMFHSLVQGIQYVVIWFCLDSFSNSIVYLVLHPTIRDRWNFRRRTTAGVNTESITQQNNGNDNNDNKNSQNISNNNNGNTNNSNNNNNINNGNITNGNNNAKQSERGVSDIKTVVVTA